MDLRAMVDTEFEIMAGGDGTGLRAGGPGSGRRSAMGMTKEEHESAQRQAEDSAHQATGAEKERWTKQAEMHQQHINRLSDGINAGGPGSGCKGENCGRRGGGKGTDKTHVPKKATISLKDQAHATVHRGENGWYWEDKHGQEYGYASDKDGAQSAARKAWGVD